MSAGKGIIALALLTAALTGCVPAAGGGSAPSPSVEPALTLSQEDDLAEFVTAEQELDARALTTVVATDPVLQDAADDIQTEWEAARMRQLADLDPALDGGGMSRSFDVATAGWSTWSIGMLYLGNNADGTSSHGPSTGATGISTTETTRVHAVRQGETASVDLTLGRSQTGPGGWSVSQNGTAKLEMPLCPDESGVIEFDLKLTIDTRASAGGNNSTVTDVLTGHTIAQINDNGDVATIDTTGDFVHTTSGSVGASSISVALAPGTADASTTGEVSDADVEHATGAGGILMLLAGHISVMRATDFFQKGYCTKIVVSPNETVNEVAVGGEQEFAVTVEHVFDGVQLEDPVKVDFSGDGSVDPTGKNPTPVTLTYTAPDERNKTGSIALESRSRRGISHATIAVKTPGGYAVHDSWPVGNGQPQTIEGVSCSGPYGPWHLVLGGDLAAFGLTSLDAYYETTIDPATMTGPVTGVEHSVTNDGQSYDGGSTGTATLTEADGGYLMSFELDYSVHWTHPPTIYSPEGDQLTGHISRNADVIAATEADCP